MFHCQTAVLFSVGIRAYDANSTFAQESAFGVAHTFVSLRPLHVRVPALPLRMAAGEEGCVLVAHRGPLDDWPENAWLGHQGATSAVISPGGAICEMNTH